MRFHFCGGAGEIGASCILLTIDDCNIVLDCGMRMGSGKDPQPDLHSLQEAGGVDAVLVSHAHMDHTGSLPILCRAFPRAKLYMTHATKDLVRVLLYDSLKLMDMREAEIPLYSEGHVRDLLERAVCFSPGFAFAPVDGELTAVFHGAGHVAGAVAIQVSGRGGSVLYSGDFSSTPQRTVPGHSIPPLRPDVAILESTYGDRLHSNRELEESRLVERVREVTAAGGKILIPAFALGRAQEVILILKRAMNKGQLPKTRVYVDGMVKDICRVYQASPNYLHPSLGKRIVRGHDIFFDELIVPVTGKHAQREAIIASAEPCCIISSSGMLAGGPSQWYAARMAGSEQHYIALTGYQDEESPGRHLSDLSAQAPEDRTIRLGDQTLPVKCGIGTYGLSAHADRTEIGALAAALKAKRIYLVHGNPDAMASLAADLQLDIRGEIHIPVNGETYDIASPAQSPARTAAPHPPPATAVMPGAPGPSEEGLPALHAHVLATVGTRRGLTLEHLHHIWTGNPDMDDASYVAMRHLMATASAYFTSEARRPFIYHAAALEDVAEVVVQAKSRMEANAMLSVVDEVFPSDTGLYRKGAKPDEGIALLYFNYPKAAGQHASRITEFEARTGWTAQLNSQTNLAAAQALITRLLTGGGDSGCDAAPDAGRDAAHDAATINALRIERISYHEDRGAFRVKCSLPGTSFATSGSGNLASTATAALAAAAEEFKATTGLDLLLEGMQLGAPARAIALAAPASPAGAVRAAGAAARAAGPLMEQNAAMAEIDAAFALVKDRPYRKSIKADGDGSGRRHIELSFISSAVGERNRPLLSELSARIGWELRVNPSPNQNDLLQLARSMADGAGAKLRKGPSYLPGERCVSATLADEDRALDKAVLDRLKAAYEETAGVPLVLI